MILSAFIAQAKDVTFWWKPNTEPDVLGYKIHYGPSSRSYTKVVDAGLPEIKDGVMQYTVTDIPEVATFYAVTAYDKTSESGYSNEVNFDPPPGNPIEFKINGGFTVKITPD